MDDREPTRPSGIRPDVHRRFVSVWRRVAQRAEFCGPNPVGAHPGLEGAWNGSWDNAVRVTEDIESA